MIESDCGIMYRRSWAATATSVARSDGDNGLLVSGSTPETSALSYWAKALA
ncbi:MAG TPA: hypothetical protein VNZ26_36060 [Vicinamibacterales bacterium]|jgi:hypothetical protein|nr:hypothetical protein [Vicinamibacterales bacterium]